MTFLSLPDFMCYAWLAGGSLGLLAGPVGSVLIWRRLAFLGDTLAHAALLGVALAIWATVAPLWGVMGICLTLGGLLWWLSRSHRVGIDAWLAVISHGSLALGLLAVYFVPTAQTQLMQFLAGDILTVTGSQALATAGLALSLMAVVWRLWPDLVAGTLDESLAQVEGRRPRRAEAIYVMVLALFIAFAVRLVGILLITAMLLMPAVAGRYMAKTPEQMATFAALSALLSVSLGLWGSYWLDLPTGPSIVTVNLLWLIIVATVHTLYRGITRK